MRSVPCPETEKLNGLSHILGVGLALSALTYLMLAPSKAFAITITQVIYVLSLVNVYTASSLFHLNGGTDQRLLRWDRSAVYGVIAASYFAVSILLPQIGLHAWVPMAVVAFGLLGIFCECTVDEKLLNKLAPPAILALIWFGIPFGDYMVDFQAQLILLGVATYTLGAVFNVADILFPICHVFWHLAVVLGSAFHFAAFALL